MARTWSFAEMAEELGVSAKKLRALHRKHIRANGGVIGKDTPGRGKTYRLSQSEYNAIKSRCVEALSSNDDDAATETA